MIEIKATTTDKLLMIPVLLVFVYIGYDIYPKSTPILFLLYIIFAFLFLAVPGTILFYFGKEKKLSNQGLIVGTNMIPWSEFKQIKLTCTYKAGHKEEMVEDLSHSYSRPFEEEF